MWKVAWSDKSFRQLRKMDKRSRQRVYDGVLGIVNEPYMAVARLANSPFYRLRVGDYRVILDIRENIMTIFVVETDHRKRIYG